MISKGEGWYYIAVKKPSALLRERMSKNAMVIIIA